MIIKNVSLIENGKRHFTKEEFNKCKNIKKNIDFFLSHKAPKNICDVSRGLENHYGVKKVKELLDILSSKVSFFVVGHLHQQQLCNYKETIVINPGYGVYGDFSIIDLDSKQIEFYKNHKLKEIFNINLIPKETIIIDY